jgi:hypothetical protein
MTKNISWLRYRAMDGILDTHFYADGDWPGYVAFVQKALEIAESDDTDVNSEYRLLDTFFSDSISGALLKQIFGRASSTSPVRMLVVDPTSPFAENRATSIGDGSVAERAHKGLKFIAEALKIDSVRDINVQDPDDPALLSLIHKAEEQANINIQFYSAAPSGPLYFFKNIVLCGRFCSGKSAIKLPWSMIINDPHRDDDLYDTLAAEFEVVWGESYKYPGGWLDKKRRVFLSYSEHDCVLADEIRQRFNAKHIECFMASRDLTPGNIWTDELRQSICNSMEVVALLTPHSVLSPCVQAELGAAWVLNLRITPAILGAKLAEVLHFVENRQAIDVSTSEGMQRLVNAVAERLWKRL